MKVTTRALEIAIRKWLVIGPVSTILLTGCIVIPMNAYDSESRSNVSAEILSQLKTGITTREEVLLMLGEPDYGYNDDELILVYKWQKIEGFSLIAIPYSQGIFGGGGLFGTNYQLNIKFDEKNRLSDVGLIKLPRPDPTSDWEF